MSPLAPILCLSLTHAILAQGTSITFRQPASPPPQLLGHAHIFSGKKQTLHLHSTPPLRQPITAKLFRVTGTTLTPAGKPISIPPAPGGDIPVTINLPASNKTLHYTLILDTRPRKHLNITAHPQNLLAPVRQRTNKFPLQILNAPPQLSKTLHQLDIPTRVLNTPSSIPGGILILYAPHNEKLTNLPASRIIIADTTLHTNRETWILSTPRQWKITIPAHYLTPKHLQTIQGQSDLRRILLTTPK